MVRSVALHCHKMQFLCQLLGAGSPPGGGRGGGASRPKSGTASVQERTRCLILRQSGPRMGPFGARLKPADHAGGGERTPCRQIQGIVREGSGWEAGIRTPIP